MGPKWGNAGYMNVYNEKGSGMCEFNTNPVFPGNTKWLYIQQTKLKI